jgi:HEAT repeat protein
MTTTPVETSKVVLADLIRAMNHHQDPEKRRAALEMVVCLMPAQPTVNLLIDRLKHETDISILFQCLGWLLQAYFEETEATKAILGRLEREPDPTLRRNILQMVSLRLGTSDRVRRTVARLADADPDPVVRAEATETLAELEQLRFAPPPPAPVSHSSRLLEDAPEVVITYSPAAN